MHGLGRVASPLFVGRARLLTTLSSSWLSTPTPTPTPTPPRRYQDLECELNVLAVQELSPTPATKAYILSHQIKRLLLAYSVVRAAGPENAASKAAARIRRGRDRLPRLLFDAATGTFSFR